MKTCKDMTEVRAEIDRVDQLIVDLLHERLGYIKQAGHIKLDRDTVRDEWRIEDVVSKVKARIDELGGDAAMIEDVYRFLIDWSISHEFDVYDQQRSSEEKGKIDAA